MSGRNVYLNGTIVPAAEAKISVSDAGFLHGASAFTTMLAHNGVVFRLGRHLARLAGTVKLLGLRAEVDADALAAATSDLLSANGLVEARVRITLSPGSVDAQGPTTVITADPVPEYPAEWYEKGISVVVSSLRQVWGSPIYGHKTGCYLPRVLARHEAAAKGAEEALWFTADNRLAEACFCNVFLVLAGEAYTPPRDMPVLLGVVREAVLELCGELGIACHDDRTLTIRETLDAQEVFLTASCSGIRPVTSVERHIVGEGEVGPVTRKLMQAYRELLDRECTA
jgi:branched-chain amino acid aminotransferase